MEQTISQLLQTYETGKITRRALVRGLALLAVGSGSASAAGFQGSGIDHVSLYVSNLQQSTDFYVRVFGCPAQKREGNVSLSFGKSRLVLRPDSPVAKVDHLAIAVENFNKDSVISDLKGRGAKPYEQGTELRVNDPDGFPLQLSPAPA